MAKTVNAAMASCAVSCHHVLLHFYASLVAAHLGCRPQDFPPRQGRHSRPALRHARARTAGWAPAPPAAARGVWARRPRQGQGRSARRGAAPRRPPPRPPAARRAAAACRGCAGCAPRAAHAHFTVSPKQAVGFRSVWAVQGRPPQAACRHTLISVRASSLAQPPNGSGHAWVALCPLPLLGFFTAR